MHWLLSYFLTYVIGGLTFVPLVVLVIFYYLPRVPSDDVALSQLEQSEKEKESALKGEDPGYRSLKAGEILDKATSGVNTFQSGWITVTKEFYTFPQINPKEFSQSGNSSSSSSSNPSGTGKNNNSTTHENSENDSNTQVSNSSGTSAGNITIASSIAKIMKGGSTSANADPNAVEDPASLDAKKLKNIRRKNRYFAVLKHGNLFLYNNEEMTNVQHVIVMANYVVTIWPRNLRDGKLFSKKTAICLLRKDDQSVLYSHNKQEPLSTFDLLTSKEEFQNEAAPRNAFYLYGDLNHQKEDWYFALIKATTRDALRTNSPLDLLEPSFYAHSLHYNTADMIDLIQTLNSTEGQLTTKWLNALIGRLFLSLHKTETFHSFIRNRVEIQLQKIKKPGFLDDFVIKKIDVGHSAPFISHPVLKTLSPEGDLEAVVNFLYQGGLTVEISTKVFLNLGVRFKPREFSINLKVKLKRIHGDLLIKMKPAPSNRLWYGFTEMPKLDLVIEPVVSAVSFNYNLVTNIISNKFKEAIRDTLVMPFMDDFVFAKTEGEIFRGGIWDKSFRPMQMDDAYAALNKKKTRPVPTPIPHPVAQSSEGTETSYKYVSSIRSASTEAKYDNSNPPPVPNRSRTPSNATASLSDLADPQEGLSVPSPVSHIASLKEESEIIPESNTAPLEGLEEIEESSSIVSKGSSSGVSKFKSQTSSLSKRVLDIVDKKVSSSFTDLSAKSSESDSIARDESTGEINESSFGINSAKNNKYVANSVTKLKGWYSKEKQKLAESRSTSNTSVEKKSYVAPEMISSRRVKKQSSSNSINSREGTGSTGGFGEPSIYQTDVGHKQVLEAIPPIDSDFEGATNDDESKAGSLPIDQKHLRKTSYDGVAEMILPRSTSGISSELNNGAPQLPERTSPVALQLDTESSMFINDSSSMRKGPVSPITSPNISNRETPPRFPLVSNSVGHFSPLANNIDHYSREEEEEEETTSDFVNLPSIQEHAQQHAYEQKVKESTNLDIEHHDLHPKLSVKRRVPPPLPAREVPNDA